MRRPRWQGKGAAGPPFTWFSGSSIDFVRCFAVAALLFAAMVAPLRAETSVLHVWSERLTLYAAPSFSATVFGELPYGASVEALSQRGLLVRGILLFPPWSACAQDPRVMTPAGPQLNLVRLHGHWLHVRSTGGSVKE